MIVIMPMLYQMTKKTKILIIEDDHNLRELYREVLSQNGYEIEAAADGEAGLLKLQQGGHDLVLLDMMLPKLNGIEILKQLKTHPVPSDKLANGRIVLMSNLSDESVIQEAEDFGATSHIIKAEITPGILLEHVKLLLKT